MFTRNELLAADKEGRICRVLYDASKPVDTFWDLGYFDNLAIWLAQSVGFEFRFIDFVQGSQQDLQYYLRELQSHPYVYGTDYLPWDGGTPSLQTGRSIRDQMIAAGRRVRVMPQLKQEVASRRRGPSSGSVTSTPTSASTASRRSGITAARWMRSCAAYARSRCTISTRTRPMGSGRRR